MALSNQIFQYSCSVAWSELSIQIFAGPDGIELATKVLWQGEDFQRRYRFNDKTSHFASGIWLCLNMGYTWVYGIRYTLEVAIFVGRVTTCYDYQNSHWILEYAIFRQTNSETRGTSVVVAPGQMLAFLTLCVVWPQWVLRHSEKWSDTGNLVTFRSKEKNTSLQSSTDVQIARTFFLGRFQWSSPCP